MRVERALRRLHAPSAEHVHFLERQTKVIGSVQFIGCLSTSRRRQVADTRRAAEALIREAGRDFYWEAVDEVSLALLRAIPSEPT